MAVELTIDSDFKEKINQNEKVVVKYYADWCGSCRISNQNTEDFQKTSVFQKSPLWM